MNRECIPTTRTLGIDLASQAKETGVCAIDWATTPGVISDLGTRALDDERLLELVTDPAVSKVGIDAPFAWPVAFVDAVSTYRDHGTWLPLLHEDVRFRLTEREAERVTGQKPLSVATSDLAWPTMRLAHLFTELAASQGPLDRTGGGRVAEIYPAAALRRWGVIEQGTSVSAAAYKGTKPGRETTRRAMMTKLRARLEGRVVIDDDSFERCVSDDDDLDALICALVARLVELGKCSEIPPGMRWAAVREGWIHLPYPDSLEQLASAYTT